MKTEFEVVADIPGSSSSRRLVRNSAQTSSCFQLSKYTREGDFAARCGQIGCTILLSAEVE